MEEYILPPNFNEVPRLEGTGSFINEDEPGRNPLLLASTSQYIRIRSYFFSTRDSLQLLLLGCFSVVSSNSYTYGGISPSIDVHLKVYPSLP